MKLREPGHTFSLTLPSRWYLDLICGCGCCHPGCLRICKGRLDDAARGFLTLVDHQEQTGAASTDHLIGHWMSWLLAQIDTDAFASLVADSNSNSNNNDNNNNLNADNGDNQADARCTTSGTTDISSGKATLVCELQKVVRRLQKAYVDENAQVGGAFVG